MVADKFSEEYIFFQIFKLTCFRDSFEKTLGKSPPAIQKRVNEKNRGSKISWDWPFKQIFRAAEKAPPSPPPPIMLCRGWGSTTVIAYLDRRLHVYMCARMGLCKTRMGIPTTPAPLAPTLKTNHGSLLHFSPFLSLLIIFCCLRQMGLR
jgi:hypothetical protein